MKIISKANKEETTINELTANFTSIFFKTNAREEWSDYPTQIDSFITYVKDNYIISKDQQDELEYQLFNNIEKEIKKRGEENEN